MKKQVCVLWLETENLMALWLLKSCLGEFIPSSCHVPQIVCWGLLSSFSLLFDACFIHFGVCAFYCDSPLVFKKIFFHLLLAELGLCCCAGFCLVSASRGCSLVALCGLLIQGGFSCCGSRALGRTGFSSCGMRASSCGSQALEHGLNSCGGCMGLVGPWYVGSSWVRDWTHVPCIGRLILYQLVTREAPKWASFKKNLFDCLEFQVRHVGSWLQCVDSSCGRQAPEYGSSVVALYRLSCSATCGILVPRPGIELVAA